MFCLTAAVAACSFFIFHEGENAPFWGPSLTEQAFAGIYKYEAPSEFFFTQLARGCNFENDTVKRFECLREVLALRENSHALQATVYLLGEIAQHGERPEENLLWMYQPSLARRVVRLRFKLRVQTRKFLENRAYMRQVLVTYSS